MPSSIRDGKRVWPTCDECGCRLNLYIEDSKWTSMRHFGLHYKKDARGCTCSQVNTEFFIKTEEIEHIVGV